MKSPSLLALTASLLLAVSASIVIPIAPAQAQTTAGYELLNKGWVNDAIAAFQSALKKNPQDLSARLGLAKSFLKAGKLDEAWSHYQQAIVQDNSNSEALLALGTLGEYRGSWQTGGIQALTQFLKREPSNRAALAQRALLLGYQGDFSRSLADYDLILKDKPSPAVLIGAAKINTYAGNSATALTLFEQAKGEQAKAGGMAFDDYTLAAYTTALTKTGRAIEADRLLGDRLMMKGIDASAEFELRKSWAIALGTQGKIDPGLKVLAQSTQSTVQPAIHLSIAEALSELARLSGRSDLYTRAIDQYRSLLKTNPTIALQVEAADVMSEQLGTRSEALELYTRVAASVDPTHPVQIKRDILAYRLGKLTAAQLTEILTGKSTPQTPESTANRTIAQALIPIDPPDAVLLPIYKSVVGNSQAFLYYRIAQIHIQANKFDEARSALTQYQSTPQGAKDISPELLLANIAQRSGAFETSATAFESIISKTDRLDIKKSALRGLAGVRVQQGQPIEALKTYDRILALDPSDTSAKLGSARFAMLTRQMKVAEAETILNQWLESYPNATPPIEFFDLLGELPTHESRADLYDRLLKLNPADLKLQRRSIELLAQRDPVAARKQLDAFMARSGGDITAYYLQGQVARSLSDLELAASAYNAILAKQPDNVDALTALGGVRFEQERYDQARGIYHRAIALRPNDWSLRRTLADLSLAQDEPFTALEQLKLVQSLQRQQGVKDDVTDYQITRLEIERLKRRSFQPDWEGYTPLRKRK